MNYYVLLKIIFTLPPTGTCTRPTIESGTISPSSATIVVGESYTLTCDDGYSISGDPTMDCYDGGDLSTLPNCTGIYSLTFQCCFSTVVWKIL